MTGAPALPDATFTRAGRRDRCARDPSAPVSGKGAARSSEQLLEKSRPGEAVVAAVADDAERPKNDEILAFAESHSAARLRPVGAGFAQLTGNSCRRCSFPRESRTTEIDSIEPPINGHRFFST